MIALRSIAVLLSASTLLVAGVARTPRGHLATGKIAITPWPYLPGSVIPLRVDGFQPPYHTLVLGAGRLLPGGLYDIPQETPPSSALLIAGNTAGLAATTVRIGAPPRVDRSLLIVASYDDGLVFHDARSFAILGVLATGGAPSDVAVDALGRIAVTDTQGSILTMAMLSPWSVARVGGVVLGDEVAMDRSSGAVFVTDRDTNGTGALTRVSPRGNVTRVATGATAEGLAVDDRRHVVYVANVNDGTVTAVDARLMRIVRRFHAVSRVFSLALSPDGSRLYGISNQSAGSPFAAPGSAIALAVRGAPHIVARSGDLGFPIGAALDPKTRTLFVTDEGFAQIDVLDSRSLRRKSAPLHTCTTPWKPLLDFPTQRLYVPCAGANVIDAFDARTLRRVRGAPFATGSYPLAVAIWRPSGRAATTRRMRGKWRMRREVQRAAR